MEPHATTQSETLRTRQSLLETFEQETATTLKLLRAYPSDQSELQPHPRLKTARELAWLFAQEQRLAAEALRDEMKLGGGFPAAPATFEEVVAAFERSRTQLLEELRNGSEAQLEGTVRFFTGPKQMGDIPKTKFLWFLLHDQIHHRGQFSVYLRIAGGKVPSIYGPSADEPWS
ncbi:MAG TPA: DinB family protein [Longimicrobiales bacterium]|nr:DinB family protein [Longimicrobiales bacterium]